VVAGLDPDPEAPGFKRILMRPQPGGGLTHARAEHTTPFGRASIGWVVEADRMRVDVVVPHNTTALISLPGASLDTMEADGVRFSRCAGGAEALVGSGSYTFRYPRKTAGEPAGGEAE
jgi:alpha-L-rhamnosidase